MAINDLFTNWREGGNNYVLKGDSKSRWVGFNKNTIEKLKSQFGLHFNIVIWGTKGEKDFYCVPFAVLEHLFTTEHMTTGKKAEEGMARWTATIDNNIFKMHANANFSVDISKYYGNPEQNFVDKYVEMDQLYDVDYTIEDATANIKVRIGQSKFRQAVLENYAGKCAISGIDDARLLIASHIVPWSQDKHHRSDPSNGICLFIEYDAYFDKGYISFDDNMIILVTDRMSEISAPLRSRLQALAGKRAFMPQKLRPQSDHLKFHRDYVFNKF